MKDSVYVDDSPILRLHKFWCAAPDGTLGTAHIGRDGQLRGFAPAARGSDRYMATDGTRKYLGFYLFEDSYEGQKEKEVNEWHLVNTWTDLDTSMTQRIVQIRFKNGYVAIVKAVRSVSRLRNEHLEKREGSSPSNEGRNEGREAARKWKDKLIKYAIHNPPLKEELTHRERGRLASPNVNKRVNAIRSIINRLYPELGWDEQRRVFREWDNCKYTSYL